MIEPQIPVNESRRIKSLRSYNILDTASDPRFDNITRLAANITSSPISLITLIDSKRQWFKSSYGTVIKETPRKFSYCGHTIIHDQDFMEVTNANEDIRFTDNPFLTGEPYIRYYLGIKLISDDDQVLGTLCVIDNQPKKLSRKEKDLLITLADQVRLELEAWKSEQKNKLFFETYKKSNDAHAWFGKEGDLLHFNPKFQELIMEGGGSKKHAPLLEIINRDKKNNIIDPEEKPFNFPQRKFTIQRNKKELTIHVEYQSIIIDGKPVLHIKSESISKDLTNPKEFEKERINTIDVLEHLQGIAHIGYWELDMKTNELFWSNVVKEIHEVELDEQPNLERALSFYKGRNRLKINQTIQEAIEKGNPWNIKLSIITAKGNEKWIRTSGQCIMKNSKPVKAFGIILDISEELEILKKISLSEEKFRLLANNSNDMVALHKEDGTFSYVTPACKLIIGYDPSELIDKSPYEFFHPEDLERIQETAHDPVLEEATDIKIEYRMLHKSGHYVWLETLSKSIFKDGKLDFIITSSRDISERVSIQESLEKNYNELEEAKNKAEEAANAKKHFLATMSHEIRTPLNAINGLAHLLLLDNPKEDQIENLKLLKFSGDNLLALINDILDISKIDTGKLELNEEAFDFNYIADNIHKSLHIKSEENNVNFTIDYDPELPKIFVGDKNRLSQIIYNLVGNALKFTKDGEVLLYIHGLNSADENYNLRVGVRDNGIGISKDQQERIFTAFEQADSNITRKYGGTGLGLYITCKLLKLMNSDIKLESTPNQGSHFYFDLNLKKGSLSLNSYVSATVNNFKDKDIRVLVVEDNLANQMIIKKFMQLYKIKYDFANNGKEGFLKAKNKSYNMIFMDLHMPEMDGFEATRKIRKLKGDYFSKIPIIALTADAFQEVKSKTQSTGMDDYLSKPFKPEDLVKVILSNWSKVDGLRSNVKEQNNLKLSRKVINIADKINELSSGDEAFEIEFAQRCKENFIEFKNDLFSSVEQRDKDKIEFSFHKLKSVLITLGSQELIKEVKMLIESWHKKDLLQKQIVKVEAITEHHIAKLDKIIKDRTV